MVKSKLEQRIIDELENVAADHDIDIVDVEMAGATKAPVVRVRLERADGSALGLDEIAGETGWVSSVVEAIDPVPSAYTLEVSSAGMARPLRRPRDFMRFVGSDCELTSMATEGRKRYTGRIEHATEDAVTLVVDDETFSFTYDDIKKCVLKPVYDFKGSKEGKKN